MEEITPARMPKIPATLTVGVPHWPASKELGLGGWGTRALKSAPGGGRTAGMPEGVCLIFDISSPPVVVSEGAGRSRQDGEGGQRYLGKAAETREPVPGRSRGCLSGPGGRRQRGPREGRRSLSARSRAASSGTAPAAPARHKQHGGLVRVWRGRGGHGVPA